MVNLEKINTKIKKFNFFRKRKIKGTGLTDKFLDNLEPDYLDQNDIGNYCITCGNLLFTNFKCSSKCKVTNHYDEQEKERELRIG